MSVATSPPTGSTDASFLGGEPESGVTSKVVLFIDDDVAFREAARRACAKLEVVRDVLLAPEGATALRMMEQAACGQGTLPNVVFVDITMPVMDGFKFVAGLGALCERYPVLLGVRPVVMLTSSDHPKDRERAEGLRVDDYLVKPTGLVELRETLGRLLR